MDQQTLLTIQRDLDSGLLEKIGDACNYLHDNDRQPALGGEQTFNALHLHDLGADLAKFAINIRAAGLMYGNSTASHVSEVFANTADDLMLFWKNPAERDFNDWKLKALVMQVIAPEIRKAIAANLA